jgi:ubiquinone/menaquinone biosynthesis C-methylase UbiE
MTTKQQKEQAFHDQAFREGTRAKVTEFYAVVRGSRAFYEKYLAVDSSGKRILEYGCGPGSYAFFLAERGATVTGIDISPVAIEQAREHAKHENIDRIEFRIMDAEKLEFPDGSFDLVCGTGILHHLDLDKAFSEIARVLRPDGSAIFIEPLGHNPLVNLYRKRTPDLRTADEHPLLMKDLRRAADFFDRVETHPYGLLTLTAIPFRKIPGFRALLATLETVDRILFGTCPFTRKYAWQGVVILCGPMKDEM